MNRKENILANKNYQITVNSRVLAGHLTGVQRYLLSILANLPGPIKRIAPAKPSHGIRGHVWEQLVLPCMVTSGTLFSPSTTGPLMVRNQVVTVHDLVPMDCPESLNPRFATWYRALVPRLAQRVAHVITISEFSKERLLAFAPMDESRITVIHNGIDTRFFPMDPAVAAEELQRLSLPSCHYVLCVGSLEPRKNLGRLLAAWARIQSQIPEEIWLVLTGKRGDAHVFAEEAGLAALPPRVHLTGHVPDAVLPALYSKALAFAYPSVYEGFGLPPLEAMASGIPVVAGNRTALPEVVGDAGLLVNPYQIDDIAEALMCLIQDSELRAELRTKGLERARQFRWDVTASRTWNILQKVSE